MTDLSGLSGQEIADAIKENSRAMAPKMIPGKKDWLALNIFTDCFLDDTALKAFSKVRKTMEPHFIATAEVGMNDIQKAGLDIRITTSRDQIPYRFFDDVKEAKDWLTSMYAKHMNQAM